MQQETTQQLNLLQQAIIETWGLSRLPASQQLEVMAEVMELLMQSLIVASFEHLTEEEKTELDNKLEDNSSPEKVFTFINEKIPYFEELVAAEAQKLHTELVK